MKSIIIAFTCLMLPFLSFFNADAQKYYVAYNPMDCTNCVKGIELFTNPKESIYFFQEQYRVDSNNLKRRYIFDDKAKIVFSDSLFNKYAIDGFSAISNEEGSLKYSSKFFNKNAKARFDKLSQIKQLDTITFNSPIAKLSIPKFQFDDEGRVYFIDAFNNSIINYNLVADTKTSEITLDEKTLRETYTKFNLGDTSAYLYYKKGTERFTRENLSIIKDISLSRDTLYACLSNYFFYLSGNNLKDSFFTHFESIAAYKDGICVATFVPFNIKEMLLDSTKQFFPIPENIYKYKKNIYTRIYKSLYYTSADKFIIGKYSIDEGKLTPLSKLSSNNNFDYNSSNAHYADKYFIISKSNELYDIETGISTALPYFDQEFLDGKIYPKLPNYMNEDFKIDEKFYYILYYQQFPEFKTFYVKINRSDNNIVFNKEIPNSFNKRRNMISPYDPNLIMSFYDNNKIINYRMSE